MQRERGEGEERERERERERWSSKTELSSSINKYPN